MEECTAPHRKRVLLPFLVCFVLVVMRCDEATGPLAEKPSRVLERAAGISDEVSDPATIDLLADSTDGSSADLRNLSVQLDAILPVLARRSGVLRLWVLKDSIEATTIVSSVIFQRSQNTTTHVQDREPAAALAAAREQL